MLVLRELVISIATVAVCMLLGAAVYESVVMAPNYVSGFEALEHARGFLVASTPGSFFRILSPAAQVLLLLSVLLSWRATRPSIRWMLLASLSAAIATDAVTFTFHYPRNDILFVAPLDRSAAELRGIAQEWAWGNYVRVGLLCVAVTTAIVAMRRLPRALSPDNSLERSREG